MSSLSQTFFKNTSHPEAVVAATLMHELVTLTHRTYTILSLLETYAVQTGVLNEMYQRAVPEQRQVTQAVPRS